MKNLKICALLLASVAASQLYGMADVILRSIPPLTGVAIGALNLGSSSERLLTGIAVSAPGAIIYGQAMALEDDGKVKNKRFSSSTSRIPYYCGCFLGELIIYGACIGAGVLARAAKARIGL